MISWVLTLIIVAAVVAIALVAIRAMGVDVPPWVVQILWILVIAIVAVAAIKFLVGMT